MIKIKLIHKARNVIKTTWKYYIKGSNFQISKKMLIHIIAIESKF